MSQGAKENGVLKRQIEEDYIVVLRKENTGYRGSWQVLLSVH
jgi:hypothetical protein